MISFPNFNLSFNFSPVAFGNVRWYGVIFAFAVLVGVSFALYRAYKKGEDIDKVCDMIFITMLGAIIGARVYYVVFTGGYSFIDALKIWEGGIAIYGGIIGGALALFGDCYFTNKSFINYCDIFAPCVLLAQGIGRWGNFANREAFGGEYFGLFRMEIEKFGQTMSVHPCFLYESVWNIIGVVIILLLEKLKLKRGTTISLYLLWYGLGRAIIEPLRVDSLMLGSFRVSQLVAIFACILGLIGIYLSQQGGKNETK
jgi:phosphatidylglycerol:prolipoprotein diacylglycerol transferase